MMNFRQKNENKYPPVKIIFGCLLGIIILLYGLFEAYDYIRGPSLVINSPVDGQTLKEPLIKITGQTRRIAKFFINGHQVFARDDGSFSEPLLLGYGYNIIEVKVLDVFGRGVTKSLRLVLN